MFPCVVPRLVFPLCCSPQAIFLGLAASGNFMGSVEEMKYVGTYAPAVAKASRARL